MTENITGNVDQFFLISSKPVFNKIHKNNSFRIDIIMSVSMDKLHFKWIDLIQGDGIQHIQIFLTEGIHILGKSQCDGFLSGSA